LRLNEHALGEDKIKEAEQEAEQALHEDGHAHINGHPGGDTTPRPGIESLQSANIHTTMGRTLEIANELQKELADVGASGGLQEQRYHEFRRELAEEERKEFVTKVGREAFMPK
jgi:hypothetical protein